MLVILVIYVFNNTIKYKTNYQTDITGLGYFDSEHKYYSNIYTANYNESLAAVGTYFNESGVDYEFKIYVNNKEVLTQNGTSNFAGYKTITLNKYIPVKEGDKFKVEFKSNNIPIQTYSRQHYPKNISFISNDGEEWEDLSKYDYTVCLKVYTVETKENDTNNTNNTPKPTPVSKQNTKILAKNKVYKPTKYRTYTVTVKNSKRKLVKNIRVKLKIGKKTYTTKTNNKGVATFKIPNKKSKKKSKKSTKKSYKITATLNKNAKKDKLTLKIGSKIYNTKTNNNGKAKFNVKTSKKKIRKYKITLKTTGGQEVQNQKVTLKVNKKNIQSNNQQ